MGKTTGKVTVGWQGQALTPGDANGFRGPTARQPRKTMGAGCGELAVWPGPAHPKRAHRAPRTSRQSYAHRHAPPSGHTRLGGTEYRGPGP